MSERSVGPVSVAVGHLRLAVDTTLPDLYDVYAANAAFLDDDSLPADADADGGTLFVAAQTEARWPELVIALRYRPAGYGFTPGVLHVAETATLFVGAGTELRCYRLGPEPTRLWIDEAEMGFWSWRRHGPRVLMAAELELAAWDLSGTKLWTAFVEPPWSYTVHGDTIRLDVMGTMCEIDGAAGPTWAQLPWRP